MFHWAYIPPPATFHYLHNNNQANLPIYGCGADQLLLLLPKVAKEKLSKFSHKVWNFCEEGQRKLGWTFMQNMDEYNEVG